MLPRFKHPENRAAGASAWYGTDGALDVQRPAGSHVLAHALVGAAAETGFAGNDDFNGAQQDGFGLFDLNQRRGVHLRSSRAFLHPVLHRQNLKVFADTLVERINLLAKRATGITVRRNGVVEELTASAEVVLSAGTVNSPQLLMLSGIGTAASLQRHGVRAPHELPGVCENLQDHPTVSVAMSNPAPSRMRCRGVRHRRWRWRRCASCSAGAACWRRTRPRPAASCAACPASRGPTFR